MGIRLDFLSTERMLLALSVIALAQLSFAHNFLGCFNSSVVSGGATLANVSISDCIQNCYSARWESAAWSSEASCSCGRITDWTKVFRIQDDTCLEQCRTKTLSPAAYSVYQLGNQGSVLYPFYGLANSPTCQCPPGWTGNRCETDINECQSTPCKNNATCSEPAIGKYRCTCPMKWTGEMCDKPVNACIGVTCLNGGSCLNLENGTFACKCQPGSRGTYCHVPYVLCPKNHCLKGGACYYNGSNYICECHPGFGGEFCEMPRPCGSNPCRNLSICQEFDDRFQCICPPGYSGETCNIEVNTCDYDPCLNMGSCLHNGRGAFKCMCSDGWTGTFCEEKPSFRNLTCQNGGNSVDAPDAILCNCQNGFVGKYCEYTTSSPCSSSLCGNASCGVTSVPAKNCDACISSPCLHGGSCLIGSYGQFQCTCTPDYTGSRCQHYVWACPSSRIFDCQYGKCLRNVAESFSTNSIDFAYSCVCPYGFGGPHCNLPQDWCLSQPCQNKATCEHKDFSYTCKCPKGWIGTNCEFDYPECASVPCFNDGTCSEPAIGTYNCTCSPNYKGDRCQTGRPCSEIICPNGETCRRVIDGLLDYSECTKSPDSCNNGGTIINVDGTTKCQCLSEWTGGKCETPVDDPGIIDRSTIILIAVVAVLVVLLIIFGVILLVLRKRKNTPIVPKGKTRKNISTFNHGDVQKVDPWIYEESDTVSPANMRYVKSPQQVPMPPNAAAPYLPPRETDGYFEPIKGGNDANYQYVEDDVFKESDSTPIDEKKRQRPTSADLYQ